MCARGCIVFHLVQVAVVCFRVHLPVRGAYRLLQHRCEFVFVLFSFVCFRVRYSCEELIGSCSIDVSLRFLFWTLFSTWMSCPCTDYFSMEGFRASSLFPGVFTVGGTLGDGLQPRRWLAGRGLGCALLWQRLINDGVM